MHWLKRLMPSPAMAIACLALLVALGGTSFAAIQALPRNSVTSVQVRDFSLLSRDFKRGQIPKGPKGPAGPRASGASGANRAGRAVRRRRRLEVGARPRRRRHRRAVRRNHAGGEARVAGQPTSSEWAAPSTGRRSLPRAVRGRRR